MKRSPEVHAGGCPSARIAQFERNSTEDSGQVPSRPSELAQWPIQLSLIPPDTPFFQEAELLITADCVPFAYADYHRDFLKGKAVVIGCPKLDDLGSYREKLTEIFKRSKVKSVMVLHMEVPCCYGLVTVTKEAITTVGKDIPFREITIGIRGQRQT